MRTLELRRHTMRAKPGVHLNQQGIELARSVGMQMGIYANVFASDKPRGIETAIAMGYAVNEQHTVLGHLPNEILDKLNWPCTFSYARKLIQSDSEVAKFSLKQAEIWESLLRTSPDNSTTLIITHGGIVELGAAQIVDEENIRSLGGALAYCESITFSYENGKYSLIKIDRLGYNQRLIGND